MPSEERECAITRGLKTSDQPNQKDTDAARNTVSGLSVFFKVLPRMFLDLFVFYRPFLKPEGCEFHG